VTLKLLRDVTPDGPFGGVKRALALLCGCAALDPACAPWRSSRCRWLPKHCSGTVGAPSQSGLQRGT
jgi:hypothetical protein